MELENRTRFPAGLFRSAIDDNRLAASLAARVTYAIDDDRLVPSEEQPWPVSADRWESPHGTLDGDALFYRGGVDVLLFGHARPPRRGTTTMRVVVRVGAFSREVVVSGARVWAKGISGLSATSPRPIEAVPLTLAHAFGGRSTWEGSEVAYPQNPDGVGFYLAEASAVDRALPSLEEPDQLVTRWDARPLPAGVAPCPMGNAIRVAAMTRGGKGALQRLSFDARFFNSAHPRMIAPRAAPGTAVVVTGMTGGDALHFEIPPPALFARVRFDDEEHEEPLTVDQIGVEADARRVFLSYRFPFRYVVYPEQLRSCELLSRG